MCIKPQQSSNRLPMSPGSKCRTCWMWYVYSPSVFNVRQTVMCGIWRGPDILRVLVCGLSCTICMMFSLICISSYEMFSSCHHTRKEATLLQLSVNITKHMSIRDSLCQKMLQIFLNGSICVSFTYPVHKVHIRIFLIQECK